MDPLRLEPERNAATQPLTLAVVIPFLDEARALPATLAALLPQVAAFPGTEIVAVDGGSRDASAALLAERPRIRVIAAPRGRGSQMNAGAAATSAGVLLFLHADTRLPEGALAAILAAAARPDFVYGGFHHRFDDDDWRLAAISWLHNVRCAVMRTFYGDQGMFVTRHAFERAGRFPEARLEDLRLSQRLRTLGAPAFLPDTVVTDARKFVQMGVWTSLGRVLLILLCSALGLRLPQAFFADIR